MASSVDDRIEIFQGDITGLAVDAIVNAANSALAPGAGVCGAIHRAAGPRLAAACRRAGGCPTGQARITEGFDLAARFVIHTVGPVWRDGGAGDAALLASCYRESLRLALADGLKSIAFPAISTGVYGYPLRDATAIAVATVRQELAASPPLERVVFCVFGSDAETAYRDAIDS
jgi:O-acetyl-ADP-ribose deacetylase (regulator of RNase III)